MTETKTSSVSFDAPPIVEKLMGIEFAPIEEWGIPHFGLFWQQIKDNYPHFEVQPPLISQRNPIHNIDFNEVRCWFFHKSQTKLIQLQNGRFLYNWQKPADYEEYPHYKNIRQEFKDVWLQFIHFLDSNKIGLPNVEQCEITYVDHFVRGREWKDLSELPNLFNFWSGIPSNFLPVEPDLISLQTAYSMPDGMGRVILQLQPVTRTEDAKEVLQLQITATGKPLSSDIEDMLTWFDFGREWAVQSFLAVTPREMHEFWGIKE